MAQAVRRGRNAPFVMHLERVCQLIERGQRFTVEFHPVSDAGWMRDRVLRDVSIKITDGGGVLLRTPDGIGVQVRGLSLANYKRVWRCWQNGMPSAQQRHGTGWGG